MKRFATIVAGAALVAAAAQAQNEQKQRVEHDVLKTTIPKEGVFFERHAIGIGPDTVEFVSAEASIAGKVVKGAPYSAEAVTENTQMLPDGNRIANKSTAVTYRDSEGRTRREMTLTAIGPFATSGDAPTFVMINDPVAGVTYHLDSKTKTARKMPAMPGGIAFGPDAKMTRARIPGDAKNPDKAEKAVAEKMMAERVTVERMDGVRGVMGIQASTAPQFQIHLRNGEEPKSESLGKQTIDGLEVEGTRSTIVIPAGQIGNERDISIVNERWYSPDLQTVVMTTNSDPRMGVTNYKLTNIRRGDPHPSLFQIPSDYTLANEDGNVRFMRKIETK